MNTIRTGKIEGSAGEVNDMRSPELTVDEEIESGE